MRFEMKSTHYRSLLARAFLIAFSLFLISSIWLSGCGKKGDIRDWSPHYRKAVEAYRRGDYEKAVSLFRKALLYDSSKAEIYLDIAAIYDDFLGDASEAVSYYDKYLRAAGGGDKTEWVRKLAEKARDRLLSAEGQEQPGGSGGETTADKDELVETLREQLRASRRALAEEREKTTNLSEQISSLYAELSTLEKESNELRSRVSARSGDSNEAMGDKPQPRATGSERRGSARHGGWREASWLLCLALAILLVALLINLRHASAREKALLATVQAAGLDSTELLRKEHILRKYFWVENNASTGIVSFTEKDDEIYVCATDKRRGARSRFKGKLVGNVLTAEPASGDVETVVTKFIFAHKGRTFTAVWQGDRGTRVAAGTKAVGD